MKKKLWAISFSLILTTPCIAATSLLPPFILKNHNHSKQLVKKTTSFNDEYADFSGRWVGSCDSDPDEKSKLDIKLASNFSSISIDNISYPIDAISTQSSYESDNQENHTFHIRWSSDGQSLLITFASYFKEGNLSLTGLETIVGNAQFFMDNGQLINNYELTYFVDGVLGDTQKIHCAYKLENKN